QQTWGPVMAKGIEDTTFYRWHRLVALNEVGGDPTVLDEAGPQALHSWAARQQESWPLGMTTLSTHDTKRSEDVRARLIAVAGDAAAWERCSRVFGEAAEQAGVDRPTGHLLWQTLVGAWPISPDRLHGYLTKAVREAKQHTAWVDGDPDYEARVLALADTAVAAGPMREAVEDALARSAGAVRATVLGAKLLQLLLPGVPDTYQGCELVDLSLVDPDNRRPVDFDTRGTRLGRLESGPPEDLDDEKLLVTSRALRLRRDLSAAFDADGSYEPLATSNEHAVAVCRGGAVAGVVARAPHHLAATGGWGTGTVRLPGGRWRDELTGREVPGGEVPLVDLLATLPVALLRRTGE
ncbi:MAG TPA: malto-oligosyltrehalose synthase, partial [Nocardioidaceae bacterium]|nr:malto-oligosyltrehalose synthase [Nocardioidaceae bacterium]